MESAAQSPPARRNWPVTGEVRVREYVGQTRVRVVRFVSATYGETLYSELRDGRWTHRACTAKAWQRWAMTAGHAELGPDVQVPDHPLLGNYVAAQGRGERF